MKKNNLLAALVALICLGMVVKRLKFVYDNYDLKGLIDYERNRR